MIGLGALLLATWGGTWAWAGPNEACLTPVAPDRELLITRLEVTDHPDAGPGGPLGFGALFARFSRSPDPKASLQQWLKEWSRSQTGSGAPSEPRATDVLTWSWPKDPDRRLSLERSPFVLDAVVYRPDLRGVDAQGRPYEGELRFVFNSIRRADGEAEPFSVILEFLLHEGGPAWPELIHALGRITPTPEYVSALEDLVARLDPAGARLRTNDFVLKGVWDLREFQVDSSLQVGLQPLPGTPGTAWNEPDQREELVGWISGLGGSDGFQLLPPRFQTGNSSVPSEGFTWLRGTSLPEATRHRFALQTCSGCHSGETITRFNHVFPRKTGAESRISGFLELDLPERAEILSRILCGGKDAARALIAARRRPVH